MNGLIMSCAFDVLICVVGEEVWPNVSFVA